MAHCKQKVNIYQSCIGVLEEEKHTIVCYMYDSDISDQEDHWINEVYCIRYGLNHVNAVPREEWEE